MASMALSAMFLSTHALAQQSQKPAPTTIDTRIGKLQYEVGFPTAETAQKIYDEMDFQRAVLAYQYAETLVSFNEMNEGFKKIGANEGDVSVFERFLDPKGLALTGNDTTIYAMSWLDLAKDGPMVLEMPANSYGAFFDLWQQPIMEFGPVGIDKGKGGKFLVLPIDYKEKIPEGYFIVKSRTTLAQMFTRAIVKNGDVAGAAKSLEVIRVYPLSKAGNPPDTKVVRATGEPWYTISPRGFEYWNRVVEVLKRVSPDEDGDFLAALLKPLGIERGEPFQPDARQKQILTDAAVFGWAMSQAISMAPRQKDAIIYPGTQWEWVLRLDPGLPQEFWRELELRTAYYFHATMAAQAMKKKAIGAGSQYLKSGRDSAGNWLDGGKQYRLRVPANPPAKNFWSVTVYDYETRSQIQTDMNDAARSSMDKLIANADGSIDLYFGPKPPEGKEANWVKTVPGRGWFVWFRLYGPTETFFDKSWALPDFELVQ